jgi:hypothetical protein
LAGEDQRDIGEALIRIEPMSGLEKAHFFCTVQIVSVNFSEWQDKALVAVMGKLRPRKIIHKNCLLLPEYSNFKFEKMEEFEPLSSLKGSLNLLDLKKTMAGFRPISKF